MSYKYKYFIKKDPKKEQVGIVKAINIQEAKKTAAGRKKINVESFNNLFDVEKL
jgi:hypothetical protein|tara:strand:- start:138 stop:299 length:162 start_codon:yes stop_codon:yes gene_type:complete